MGAFSFLPIIRVKFTITSSQAISKMNVKYEFFIIKFQHLHSDINTRCINNGVVFKRGSCILFKANI